MNQYQFEQVCRRMEKRYGKIRKGEESRHEEGLRAIETNLLTVHRLNRAFDSRRVLEAVPLALYAVESRLTGQEYDDLSAFENPENLKLKHAILMAFDPFTNAELRKEAEEKRGWNLDDGAELEAYYQRPVQCVADLGFREEVDKGAGKRRLFQLYVGVHPLGHHGGRKNELRASGQNDGERGLNQRGRTVRPCGSGAGGSIADGDFKVGYVLRGLKI